MKVRVGFGYDVHALVPERDLWLGGVKIEHTMGLQGHSDADVLIHAICDALLVNIRTSTARSCCSIQWNCFVMPDIHWVI